jgi:ferredoxin/ribosomal protein S18 acetylase RimI-like enzyme
MQNLEFKNLQPGQGEEVCALVREAANTAESNGFTPQGRTAFERYASPIALEQRSGMGYRHELVYVSGVLAGMIELKGPQVTMLYVQSGCANSGLGSRLFARAASRCAEIDPKIKQMTVYATDEAVGFYERVGFVRSGSRKEMGGVYSTLYKFSLKIKDGSAMKLHGGAVEFFVFTGTGNSLLAAQAVAEVLRQEGASVHLHSMDEPCPRSFDEESAVGLAFPVACFSTYPTVWRFIESMPAGEGREVFMLGTCGGAPGGMQGPLRKILTKKGYKTIAAKIFIMPGNYNNKTLPAEKNAARVEKSLLAMRSFAYDLLKGETKWSGGIPVLSAFMYRLGQTRKPWNFFYKLFPIAVDSEKCTRCKRCAKECPEKAISMDDANGGYPAVDPKLCESCQRCVGFCPAEALHVPGKPAEPYKAMSYDNFKGAFK